MDALKELANKASKKGGMPDDKEKEAKMAVLQHIHKMASDAMGDDVMSGLKQNKATVTADSRAGLQEGLNKAASLVGQEGGPLDSNEMDGATEHGDADAKDDDGDAGMEDDEDEEDDGASPLQHSDGEEMHPGQPPAEHMIQDQIDHESSEGDLSEEDIEALMADLQKQKEMLMQRKMR